MMILVSAIPFISPAQKLHYDVRHNKKTVGSVWVNKVQKQGKVHYELTSTVAVEIVFPIAITERLYVTYQNQLLQHSSVENYLNGKLYNSTMVTRQGDRYVVQLDEKKKIYQDTDIHYSGVKFFYHEPEDIKQVYSEVYGRYHAVSPAGPHLYKLVMSTGQVNHYQYEHGKLVHFEMKNKLLTLDFILIENPPPSGKGQ